MAPINPALVETVKVIDLDPIVEITNAHLLAISDASGVLWKGTIEELAEFITPSVGESGSYTPTSPFTSNLNSSSPGLATYSKLGSILTVFGKVTVDSIGTGTCQTTITLPPGFNGLASDGNLTGYGISSNGIMENVTIAGDASNDRATFTFSSTTSSTSSIIHYSLQFIYTP